MRPTRLFGLDGAAEEDPCSVTGFLALVGVGLPSATAAEILSEPAFGKLQVGGTWWAILDSNQ
mgnify:CR=1 FL=1